MIQKNYRYFYSFLFLFLSISGGILSYYATFWGPWAFSDSAAYLNCAKNINAGLGISLISKDGNLYPFTIFPPLYSLILSRFAIITSDYILAARILDALCFGLLIFLICWGSMALSKNIGFALFAGFFVLCSPVILENATGLMSEPVFFILMYGSIFTTHLYLQNRKKSWLILAVLLTALAPMARYVGIFLCVLNPLIILMNERSDKKERMRRAFLFSLISVLPLIIWLVAGMIDSQTFGGRALVIPASFGQKILKFGKGTFAVLEAWIPYMGYRVDLFSDSLKLGIAGIFCAFLFAADLFFYIKKKSPRAGIFPWLMASSFLCIVLYLFVLLGTYLFASMPPDLIPRMYSPIFPAFVILFLAGIAFLLEQIPHSWKKPISAGILIFFIVALRYDLLRSWAYASDLHENGYGYTSKEIQTSGFVQAIESLPTDKTLIANSPALVMFYTNRLPYEMEDISNIPLGVGNSELDEIFSTKQAVLILDYASIRNTYPDWEQRIASLTSGLEVSYQDTVGGIYYPTE